MLATNLAASSSPVTPSTIDKSSPRIEGVLDGKRDLLLFPLLKMRHSFMKRGSASKSASLTLPFADHCARMLTI